MNCCTSGDIRHFCDQMEWDIEETPHGVRINIEPKDKSKVNSLRALFKAHKDFCGC